MYTNFQNFMLMLMFSMKIWKESSCFTGIISLDEIHINPNFSVFFEPKTCDEEFCVGKPIFHDGNQRYPIKFVDFEIHTRKAVVSICKSMNFDTLYNFLMECSDYSKKFILLKF